MTYRLEPLSNGYLVIHPNGNRSFAKSPADLMTVFSNTLANAIAEQRHFEWDGNLTITFGFDLTETSPTDH